MNFLNRALKNVTRRMSKSVLLAITFFLIGNLVIIGLGINNAAESAKVLTRQKMRAVVSYEVDSQKYYSDVEQMEQEQREEAYKNYPKLTAEQIANLSQDSRVKAVNRLSSYPYYADGFETVPLNNQREQQQQQETSVDGSVMVASIGGIGGGAYVEPDVMIEGNAYPNMIEVLENTYVVTEGRFYTQDDIDNAKPVALITEEMADLNNLRIGDTLSVNAMSPTDLENFAESGFTAENIKVNLEIIGIYKNNNVLDENSDEFKWMSRYDSPKNKVLVPSSTLNAQNLAIQIMYFDYYKTQQPDFYRDQPTPVLEDVENYSKVILLLDDPLNVDKFVAEHTGAIGEYQKLDANNETFKKLARPLDTLSMFSNIIVWIVTINAIVIITLITALTLKTREYEIGVLLSMGVSKAKIVAQFFVELVVVALIGFTLAVGSGSLVASQVGKAVLNYQVDTENSYNTEDDSQMGGGYYWGEQSYFTEVTQDDLLEQYNVTVSPLIIAEIYIMGMGVVLISILIPSIMIMRFNPKRILMNQN